MPPTIRFKVHGLDCAEETEILKRELGPLVGGEDRLSFDILNARMTIATGLMEVSADAILKALAAAGMRAELWKDSSKSVATVRFWDRHGGAVLTAISGTFLLLGFAVHAWLAGGILEALGSEGMGSRHDVPVLAFVLYGISILAGIWYTLPKAWLAAGRFRPDMNLLMVIAIMGALAIGEWLEGATVAFLFSLSLALESWSVGRARRAVEALLDLTPPTARMLHPDAQEEMVSPDQVAVGSTILVKPGERLPLDGRVLRGSSNINQAPITGESVPVLKNPGDQAFAGTINGDGALEIQTTKPAGDTTLAHIIRLVGEARSRRAPSEQWVEKFAKVYTPVVLSLALTLLLIPPLFLSQNWQEWFYRSLVLLVIACPCALVISTPVSIVAALAAAARHGVLIKGGVHVEAPARLQAIAFDKTGTLTEGKPTVVEVVPLDHTETELLERAASLEVRSEHPLAKAIVAYAQEKNVALRPAADVQILPGKGATGQFKGEQFWLGSHRYLEERGQENEDIHQRLEAMTRAGRTVVVVGDENHVCGLIAVADSVRPEAEATVKALRLAGIHHLVMLTGDNEATASAIAKETELDEVHAELLPGDKVAVVGSLLSRFGTVAMVGDGVNDAPALARATLGIAMGAAGSDAAIETADIALMTSDLSRLPWLIHHSRRTLKVIRQNIVFSLAVKAAFVVLTLGGYAYLWAAIAADMGASLLVIFNGLRLLRSKTESLSLS